jgi:uncharacterized phage protein (TIGR02220 family)
MSLSPELFKAYIFLITQADDEGRVKISYQLFCNRIFPNKKITTDKMKEYLLRLDKLKLIKIYTDGTHDYLYHPNWHTYQKISHPSKSILPSPEEFADFPEDSRKTPEDSMKNPEGSSPDQCSLVKNNLDQYSNGSPEPTQPRQNLQIFIKTIIEDWNKVTGQNRNPKSKDIQRLLKARFEEDGFTNIDDYKLVHRYIVWSWKGEKWFSKESGKPSDFYIRPKTVYSEGRLSGYGDGFAEYLEQARKWKKQLLEKEKFKKPSIKKPEEKTGPPPEFHAFAESIGAIKREDD